MLSSQIRINLCNFTFYHIGAHSTLQFCQHIHNIFVQSRRVVHNNCELGRWLIVQQRNARTWHKPMYDAIISYSCWCGHHVVVVQSAQSIVQCIFNAMYICSFTLKHYLKRVTRFTWLCACCTSAHAQFTPRYRWASWRVNTFWCTFFARCWQKDANEKCANGNFCLITLPLVITRAGVFQYNPPRVAIGIYEQ